MEIKLFGRSLFEVKKNGIELFVNSATTEANKSKFLPDFNKSQSDNPIDYSIVEISNVSSLAIPKTQEDKPRAQGKPRDKLTPKNVFELKLLHDEAFNLNADPVYVDEQISDFKDKLALIKSEEYDMRRGVEEVGSIIIRMENRKKYSQVHEFFEQFPYTTTSKINSVVKDHDYLKLGQIAQLLADLPKEATQVMKEYNKYTDKVCGKQAVFYIIADKKDFQKTEKRRDPILLAQSPFGHFWQILGAWDKEMLLVEEL